MPFIFLSIYQVKDGERKDEVLEALRSQTNVKGVWPNTIYTTQQGEGQGVDALTC